MLGRYTGMLHTHVGKYTRMVRGDGTQTALGDPGTVHRDGTPQDSMNKEAKWTLERAPLLPHLRLTPLLVCG